MSFQLRTKQNKLKVHWKSGSAASFFFFLFYLYLALLSSVPRCDSCVMISGPLILNLFPDII